MGAGAFLFGANVAEKKSRLIIPEVQAAEEKAAATATRKTPLEAMRVFCARELEHGYDQLNVALAQGHPLEIPQIVPLGDLGRLVRTMQVYHRLAQKLVALRDGQETREVDQGALQSLMDQAQEHLDIEPPPPPPRVQSVSAVHAAALKGIK